VAASRTVFEVLAIGHGLESQVLGLCLEPSRSLKIGLSSVEDSSFLLPFKSYISLKLFRNIVFLVAIKIQKKLLPVVRFLMFLSRHKNKISRSLLHVYLFNY